MFYVSISDIIINSMLEFRKLLIIFGIQTLFSDELPESFDQIEVW